VAVAERKEPWQMTRSEFVSLYMRRHKQHFSKDYYSRLSEQELEDERDEARDYHAYTVEQALKAGKPVSSEVLEDYPDL